MQLNNTSLPTWLWHKQFKCVVKVLTTGHFPSTVMVELPDDKVIEVEVEQLEIQ